MRIVGILVLLTLSITSSAVGQVAFLDKGQTAFGMSFKADYMRDKYERGSAAGTVTAAHIDRSGFEVGMVVSVGKPRGGYANRNLYFSLGFYTEVLLVRQSSVGFPLTIGAAAKAQYVDISGREDNYVSFSVGPVCYKRLALTAKSSLMPFLRLELTKQSQRGTTIGFGFPLACAVGANTQLILSPEVYHTSLKKTHNFWTYSLRIAFCTG